MSNVGTTLSRLREEDLGRAASTGRQIMEETCRVMEHSALWGMLALLFQVQLFCLNYWMNIQIGGQMEGDSVENII